MLAKTVCGALSATVIAVATTALAQSTLKTWDEIAADGQDPHTLKAPAPTLKVAAPAAAAEMTKPRREMLCMSATPWDPLNLVKRHLRLDDSGTPAIRSHGYLMPTAGAQP